MKAKTLGVIFSIFVAIPTHTMAQEITLPTNLPRNGDIMQRTTAELTTVGKAGENQFWDFSQLQETGKSTCQYISLGDTILMAIEGGTMFKYKINNDSLISFGHENRTVTFHDSIPYPIKIFPMSYGQHFERPFYLIGRYAQDRDAETGGIITVKADATGRILLPSLDTLDNAIRIRTETHAWIRLLRQNENIGDSINTDSLPTYRKITHEWFVPGYRYPLIETRQYTFIDNGQEYHSGKTYYYSTSEQEYLAEDIKNREIRNNTKLKQQGIYYSTGVNEFNNGLGTIENITTKTTSSGTTVCFDVSGSPVKIGMTLADLYGRVYEYIPEHTIPIGTHTETIDTRNLIPGTYVFAIFVNGTKQGEIILNN